MNPNMYCIACGALGALSSSMGKLAFSGKLIFVCCYKLNDQYVNVIDLENFIKKDFMNVSFAGSEMNMKNAYRLLFFSLMLFLNGSMLTVFLKALEKNSSISVTVISTVSNIICSVSVFSV